MKQSLRPVSLSCSSTSTLSWSLRVVLISLSQFHTNTSSVYFLVTPWILLMSKCWWICLRSTWLTVRASLLCQKRILNSSSWNTLTRRNWRIEMRRKRKAKRRKKRKKTKRPRLTRLIITLNLFGVKSTGTTVRRLRISKRHASLGPRSLDFQRTRRKSCSRPLDIVSWLMRNWSNWLRILPSTWLKTLSWRACPSDLTTSRMPSRPKLKSTSSQEAMLMSRSDKISSSSMEPILILSPLYLLARILRIKIKLPLRTKPIHGLPFSVNLEPRSNSQLLRLLFPVKSISL